MAAPKLRSFAVKGRGEFPLDMLRYDMCWPQNEGESSLIIQDAERHVILSTHNTHAPTKGRWASFGWTVL